MKIVRQNFTKISVTRMSLRNKNRMGDFSRNVLEKDEFM